MVCPPAVAPAGSFDLSPCLSCVISSWLQPYEDQWSNVDIINGRVASNFPVERPQVVLSPARRQDSTKYSMPSSKRYPVS